jgi:hypothetical protein
MNGRFCRRVAAWMFIEVQHFYAASTRSELNEFTEWAPYRHSLHRPLRSAMGRKQTCQPAQLLVQATNRHSDLMLKSGPLLGPLLRFTLRLTPYKATIICEVRRPLLGTTNHI